MSSSTNSTNLKNLRYDDRVDAYYRVSGSDRYVRLQVLREYGPFAPLLNGANCIDIGANVGMFSTFALKHGARSIWAIEALPSNWPLLEKNLLERNLQLQSEQQSKQPIEVVKGAAVPPECDAEHVQIHFGRADCTARIGLPVRGGDYHNVKTRRFDIGNMPCPHDGPIVLKMDCEGSEYPLMLDSGARKLREIDSRCEAILIELHFETDERRWAGWTLVTGLINQGWRVLQTKREGRVRVPAGTTSNVDHLLPWVVESKRAQNNQCRSSCFVRGSNLTRF